MVHLIFVVKYRRNLFVKFGDEIKQIFYNIADEKNISIIKMKVDKNHIHLLVHYKSTMSVLNIVKWFKQISIYRLWRQNNNMVELTKFFWKEKTFWSDGYFSCSIGNVSKETIEKYIQKSRIRLKTTTLKGSGFTPRFIKIYIKEKSR